MATIPENQQLIPVDSMRLAYETFQLCRYPGAATDIFLDLLIRTLEQVRLKDELITEIPESWLQEVNSSATEESEINPTADSVRLSGLPPKGRQLLSLIELGAKESRRLWASDSIIAVRSLGYALHPIPGLVRFSERFDAEMFRFNFRIAAFCWTELSEEAKQVLCDTVRARREKVEQVYNQEGFAVDIFGYSRKRK